MWYWVMPWELPWIVVASTDLDITYFISKNKHQFNVQPGFECTGKALSPMYRTLKLKVNKRLYHHIYKSYQLSLRDGKLAKEIEYDHEGNVQVIKQTESPH